jgi:hypothetical protein
MKVHGLCIARTARIFGTVVGEREDDATITSYEVREGVGKDAKNRVSLPLANSDSRRPQRQSFRQLAVHGDGLGIVRLRHRR